MILKNNMAKKPKPFWVVCSLGSKVANTIEEANAIASSFGKHAKSGTVVIVKVVKRISAKK